MTAALSVTQLWSAVWLLFHLALKDKQRCAFFWTSCYFVCTFVVSVAVDVLKKGAKDLLRFMHGASPLYHLACSHPRQQLPSDPVTVVPPAAKIPPDDHRYFPKYLMGQISCLLPEAAIEKYRLDNNIRYSQNSAISHTSTRICLAMTIYSQIFSILWNNQQMQMYAVNFIPLLGSLYMFRVLYTPIIRSTIFNCTYSHWYKP